MPTKSIFEIVLCPGCGKRLPVRNSGVCGCGWENANGRIWKVREYLTTKCCLHHVGPEFLNRLYNHDVPQMGK